LRKRSESRSSADSRLPLHLAPMNSSSPASGGACCPGRNSRSDEHDSPQSPEDPKVVSVKSLSSVQKSPACCATASL
jgi:hypothetical protein